MSLWIWIDQTESRLYSRSRVYGCVIKLVCSSKLRQLLETVQAIARKVGPETTPYGIGLVIDIVLRVVKALDRWERPGPDGPG